ncbi:MAG TPA: acetyl-CoA carboxylase biotin carboxyl carrier protein [Verrucomicrobiae bacterium]|jgi:acetyl-CoA carboxylase biotin carboxyl carrier protein|nr:acetyl-CoA carboxylase biotin carboxyl carrier protein [Verrucomicrobiae bacterium]
MNIKEIKEILGLMREHDLCEIELEKEGMKLKLRKNIAGQIVMERPMAMPQGGFAPRHEGGAAQVHDVPSAEVPMGGTLVRSPMVGTFYSAPAPDQPPYASVGQTIKEGDVLCIVEAMKLMNEIKSDVSGVIEEILVDNGDPIEFDQPLFRIKKA